MFEQDNSRNLLKTESHSHEAASQFFKQDLFYLRLKHFFATTGEIMQYKFCIMHAF